MADNAFNDWRDSANTIRTTNNRLTNALEKYYNTLKENGYFKSSPTYADNEYTMSVENKNVRIPYSNSKMDGRGSKRPVVSLRNIPERYFNFFAGESEYPAVGTDMNILEYKPRLMPIISSVEDLITGCEKWTGRTGTAFWRISLLASKRYPHGWYAQYIGDRNEFLQKYANYTGCRGYKIFTGIPGQKQTELYHKEVTTSGQSISSGTSTDTLIPLRMQKTGGVYDMVYMPYMRNINAISLVAGLAGSDYFPFLLYGAEFTIDEDIHFIWASSGGGNFSANPFSSIGGGNYNLDDIPSGYTYTFTVATKPVWEDIFTGSGMPWSYDEDIVKSPDDGALTKPDEAGLPDNPTDDTPGSGDNTSDKVEYPTPQYVPNATVYDRYFLTPNQIPDVKTFLFSETFINNIKRLWTNPAEYVISLCCYPFDVAATGLTTTETVLSIGGVSSSVNARALIDKGVPYFYGGSVYVDSYYGSYLDYEPYTSIDIYIPYIGVRPLNVSQVVGHRLTIGYYIDLNTQQITALIGLDGNAGNLGQVVTQFVGSIGVQTPLSGTSAQDMIRNVVTQTAGLITGVGAIAGGLASANPALFASGAAGVGNALLGGNTTAPSYYGSLSPVSGLYTPQTAYLIINRPRQALPSAYQNQQGFSSNYSGTVAAFTGYLECLSVNMPSADTMTDSEHDEIIALMKGGIYCG